MMLKKKMMMMMMMMMINQNLRGGAGYESPLLLHNRFGELLGWLQSLIIIMLRMMMMVMVMKIMISHQA